jgi:hypothetical protein
MLAKKKDDKKKPPPKKNPPKEGNPLRTIPDILKKTIKDRGKG